MAENLSHLVTPDAMKNSTIRAIVEGVVPHCGWAQFQDDVCLLLGRIKGEGIWEVETVDREKLLGAIFRVHPYWKAAPHA